MKIAILSCLDYSVPGGAERFFIDMAHSLNAAIVCLSYDPKLADMYPAAKDVHFHPLNRKLPREPFRQFFGMSLFRSLHLQYDFFIVTDDMSLRYLRHDIPHLYFMLTPRRALYDMYYPTLASMNPITRPFFSLVLIMARMADQSFVRKHVRNIAGISHTVRTRIWKAYGRDATVIYPPIHVNQYKSEGRGNFWLCVSRVDKWKRIELIVEAFRHMPDLHLVIAGKVYPPYKSLVETSPDNVRFTGSVSDEKLLHLYGNCRGFITMAIDEDYGLTPLEAMASGKPVIAAREGGYQETVIHGKTGLLISPQVGEIVCSVRKIESDPDRYYAESVQHVKSFDYNEFARKLVNYINSIVYKEDMKCDFQ